MKEFWGFIQLVFAGIGGWLGWFLGGCDGLLYALLAFVVIDYITGVMCAIVDHTLSSAVGFKGICRKVLIFALVGIGHILDTQVIGSGSVLRTAVIFSTFPMKACRWQRTPPISVFLFRRNSRPFWSSFTTVLRKAAMNNDIYEQFSGGLHQAQPE